MWAAIRRWWRRPSRATLVEYRWHRAHVIEHDHDEPLHVVHGRASLAGEEFARW